MQTDLVAKVIIIIHNKMFSFLQSKNNNLASRQHFIDKIGSILRNGDKNDFNYILCQVQLMLS
ncbi:MAG: hypothetical protein ABI416_15610 [Ginsengibacter sp.]